MTNEEANMILDQKKTAVFFTGNDFDADDIMQDVAQRIINNIDTFRTLDEKEKIQYIKRSIRNKYFDNYLDIRNKPLFLLITEVTPRVKPTVFSKYDLEEALKVMDDYPFSRALKLYSEGYKIREISKIEGLEQNTVLARIRYTRSLLRKNFGYGKKTQKGKYPSDSRSRRKNESHKSQQDCFSSS